MKKSTKTLILTALILITVVIASIAVSAQDYYGTVVKAEYTSVRPDMKSGNFPDDSWGEAIHIDGKSDNACVVTYHVNNGTVDPNLSMDVYFRWDEKNLYVAMVSADDYVRGAKIHHTGDGLLLDLAFGTLNMCHGTKLLCDNFAQFRADYCYSVTFQDDDKSLDYDGATTKLKEEPVIFAKDGKICVKMVIDFVACGVSAKKDVVPGNTLSFSMCRLEATQGDDYLGWLEWGNYYDLDEQVADTTAAREAVLYPAATKTGNTILLVKEETPADKQDETPEEPPKEDVPTVIKPTEKPSNWAESEVSAAIAEGLVPAELQKNYTKGISRIDLSKMIGALLDKCYNGTSPAGFQSFTDTSDVNVQRASALGIITGYKQNDGTYMFKPENTLKRSEMAVIVSRIARVCGKETTGYESEVTFTDTVNHWCKAELGYPVHMAIVKGTASTTFSPENTLTVEQTIMMVYRLYTALR